MKLPNTTNPKLSKRKPPSGNRCDMHVGVDKSGRGAPRVLRCKNTATLEYLGAAVVGETWICMECAQSKGWATA